MKESKNEQYTPNIKRKLGNTSREMLSEAIRLEILERIDFKDGVVQEIMDETMENQQVFEQVLDVRWKGNIHFVLQMHQQNWGWYYAEKNGECISSIYRVSNFNESFYRRVQHFVEEINRGDLNNKRTVSEKIAEIIEKRQLTSYMNDTKWKEFLQLMTEEMSMKIPYAFHTLFDLDNTNDDFYDTCYCQECFNNYHFKSLEWVRVQTKFVERKHRGRLIDDEESFFDLEDEFIEKIKKYSIPYEAENGIYTIYGYR